MSNSMDMSLDDIIRNSKKSRGQSSNFKNRVSGLGPHRRAAPIRQPVRPNPYLMPPPMQAPVAMLQQQMIPIGGSNTEEGMKLYVSNLDYGVSNEDVKLLFSEVGELKRYSLHYDKSGRSKGTAEVVFTSETDALAAIKRYNNVQLDGKPMKIEVVGVNLVTPVPVPPTNNSILGKPNGAFRSHGVGARGWARGGGRQSARGHGRGHGQGRSSAEKLSAEDLDADLEKYHFEAMQIN